MLEDFPTLNIEPYDPDTDTVVIEGTKYAGVLFREGFGRLAKVGQVLRIDRMENGIVTVTKITQG